MENTRVKRKYTKRARAKLSNKVRRENFFKALVHDYGEGAVITYQELMATYNKAPEVFCHYAKIRSNPAYRVARGRYVVTLSEDPTRACEKAKKLYNKTRVEKIEVARVETEKKTKTFWEKLFGVNIMQKTA